MVLGDILNSLLARTNLYVFKMQTFVIQMLLFNYYLLLLYQYEDDFILYIFRDI